MSPSPKSVATRRERANAEALAMLDEALPRLRRTADFNGLLRAQALAQAVATTSDGAVRRKAVRMVKKARVAANKAAQTHHTSPVLHEHADAKVPLNTPIVEIRSRESHRDAPKPQLEQDSFDREESRGLIPLAETTVPPANAEANLPIGTPSPIAGPQPAQTRHENGENGARNGSTSSGGNGPALAPPATPSEAPDASAAELNRRLMAAVTATANGNAADTPIPRPAEENSDAGFPGRSVPQKYCCSRGSLRC